MLAMLIIVKHLMTFVLTHSGAITRVSGWMLAEALPEAVASTFAYMCINACIRAVN